MGLSQRFRTIVVDGKSIQCPRHINRIEQNRSDYKAWQVRFDRINEPYYSKTFNDNIYGGCPFSSLEAAREHLEDIQQYYRETEFLLIPEKTGLSLSLKRRRKDGFLYYQADITLYTKNRKKKTLSIYLGSIKTITQEKINAAVKHSKKVLKWRQDIIEKYGRDYIENIEIPDDIRHILI